MSSTLHRKDFKDDEEWRNAVRVSANNEFCKSSGCICPLYNYLERAGSKYRCDCEGTRSKIGLSKCDKTVDVCPVRNIGWPEHTPGALARYANRSQAPRINP